MPCTSLKVHLGQIFLSLLAAAALLGIGFTRQPVPVHVREPAQLGPLTTVTPEASNSSQLYQVQRRHVVVPEEQVPYQHKHSIYKRAHMYGDLPALSRNRSPSGESWDNSIAICACMFQENTTDVREWILYHRWLGIDHIYLTENSKDPPEHLLPEIQEFIDDGFISFRARPRPEFQQTFYLECMQHHRHKHNWMAFIDLDEFIVLRKKGVTLKEFLDGYKNEAGLVMHWILVGPSRLEQRPKEGGVLRRFRQCRKDPSPVVKSIANTWFLANMASNPHTFEYRNDMQSVDELYGKMPWRYQLPPACRDGSIEEPGKLLECRPLPHVQKRPTSAQHIAVFHYITKSKEDFARKVKRGGGGGTHRTWKHFRDIQRSASGRGGICDEAAAAAEKCCPTSEYVVYAASDPPPSELPASMDAAPDGDDGEGKRAVVEQGEEEHVEELTDDDEQDDERGDDGDSST